MHKSQQKANRDPSEVLREIVQKQQDYYNAWEAGWNRKLEELARRADAPSRDHSYSPPIIERPEFDRS